MRFTTIKVVLVFLLVSLFTIDLVAARHHHKQYANKPGGMKLLKARYANQKRRNAAHNMGLWPSIFNLATKAEISANVTCGENGREEFCRMVENGKGKCGVCDNFSAESGKRHSIQFAIDGSNRWWQSPALYYSSEYEFVSIVIDLKQVYQIAYIILKAANSPRPGTWILERSIDGDIYEPWQYFARNDKECLERFGIVATKGKPHYYTDSEVICTSFYSKLTPLENGEIHTSLIHGRPGANETSPELLEFTKARYVRLRLMGLRGTMEPLPRWFTQDIWKDKRLFYSIRDISIGGQCVCNGHAENCRHNVASGHPECECSHNTCGANCDKCCSMFNQRQWGPGTSRDARQCLPCNCHGHATSCHYDEDVDRTGLSMDVNGNYQGGGVCDNCTDYTAGINCEQCINGYFRSHGVLPDAKQPCLKCDCDPIGSKEGTCIQYGETAGTCQCLPGYTGPKCDLCQDGYRGYPNCEPCPCDPKGVTEIDDCEGDCKCKNHVDGKYCDHCKPGYFGLKTDLTNGCLQCICSGMTTVCESAIIQPYQIQTLEDWFITDLKVTRLIKPTYNGQSVFSVGNFELSGVESLYWLAPKQYLANKLDTYNGYFRFQVQSIVMRGDTSGEPTKGPNLILVGENGLHLAYGDDVYTAPTMVFDIKLHEENWYVVPNELRDITTRLKDTDYRAGSATRKQFLSVLADIKHILLRATFHTDQIEGLLEEAVMNVPLEEDGYGSVEKCSCPSGYTGLSCESCAFGYVRIVANGTDNEEQSFCGKCDCNGHSETCNPNTGECFCQHNTIGEKCERCAPGYYGNPFHGTLTDCKKCACPLENEENNFSPSCQLEFFAEDTEKYVCTQCPKGYTGDHCEICDDGFYGDPLTIGEQCIPCDCGGGPCDPRTGQCLSCKGNTEGWKCERCKPEHYGNASTLNCKACECDPIGSMSKQCDNVTGQCLCKERFIGRTCNQCESGYGNVTALCQKCSCSPIGSKSQICDPHTGICDCKEGVDGFHCDTCQNFYYGFSETGCKPCECSKIGSLSLSCVDGRCKCKNLFAGKTCDKCIVGYFKKNITDTVECEDCRCTQSGSIHSVCNFDDGQCVCKEGHEGRRCEKCKKNWYRPRDDMSCQKCDECNEEGHICDNATGKCVCPPNSQGEKCSECTENAWGHKPNIGCELCPNCTKEGRRDSKRKCNKDTGKCECKAAYNGELCNVCASNYYGYPDCKPCKCNLYGTETQEPKRNICNSSGSCTCKKNWTGKQCDRCIKGTFLLNLQSTKTCAKCFCFDRKNGSNTCQIAKPDELEKYGNIYYNNSIRTSTCDKGNYCWNLPLTSLKFPGDFIHFYNGTLTLDTKKKPNHRVFITSKIMKTNERVEITAFFDTKQVRLVETDWQFHNHPEIPSILKDFCRNTNPNSSTNLSRDCFLVILQNVENITLSFNEPRKRININVLPSNIEDTNVEKCTCPDQYTGLSCERPNNGYYRSFENPTNEIEKMVGIAVKCNCNGRSEECNAATGYCENCTGYSTGKNCENCIKGYYLDHGTCSKCDCNNNEKSCELDSNDELKCICNEGFDDASMCRHCKTGYYKEGSKCLKCDCDKDGSKEDTCDATGKCLCKEDFTGEKCNQCRKPRYYFDGKVCAACENDQCIQLLFHEIDNMNKTISQASNLFSKISNPPWQKFNEYLSINTELHEIFEDKLADANIILKDSRITDFEDKIIIIQKKLHDEANPSQNFYIQSKELGNQTKTLLRKIKKIIEDYDKNIKEINEIARAPSNHSKALADATKSLKHMDSIEKYFNRNYNKPHLGRCKGVEMKILNYNVTTDIQPIKGMFKNFSTSLDSVTEILEEIEMSISDIEESNIENSERIENLKYNINIIHKMKENIATAEEYLKTIKDYGDYMSNLSSELDTIDFEPSEKLEDEINKGNVEKLNTLFLLVIQHVEGLEQYVNGLKAMFRNKSIAENPAANYVNIVKKINDTRSALLHANETITLLTQRIEEGSTNNGSSEPIGVKALLLHAKSDRLLKRASNIKKNPRLGLIDTNIDNSKDKLYEYGKSNNKLLQRIQMMKTSAVDWAAILKNLSGIDEIRRIQNELNTLNLTSQYDLHKHIIKYKQILSKEEREKFYNENDELIEKLKDIKQTVNNGVKLIQNQDESFNSSRINSITNKIMELKNSILYARQAANEVHVAMELNKCSRKYRVPNSLGVWKNVKVKFKCTNCILFKALNRNKTVTLTVYNGKVHFNLNQREILSLKLRENAEETVSVEFQVPVVTLVLSENVMRESTIVEEPFYMPSTIEVGGTESIQNGYISSLHMNDEKIGLWNFMETSGTCYGTASEETSLEKGESYYFVKDAYKKYEKSNLNVKEIGMTFTFSTFDENSLIYMAQDTTNLSSFIALRLDDGHLKLHVRHIDGTEIILGTENRYNNGEMNVAVIGMQYNGATEKYNLTINNEHEFSERPLKSKNVFKIRKSHQYLGGVNPIFDKSNLPFDIPYSFQGFLKHSTGPTNLIMENGVAQYHNLQYTKAWFNGNDCLTLSTLKRPLKSIRFTFRPMNSSSFLANITNFGFISLNNDHIEFKYGQNTFIMINLIKLNDYNYVIINKTHFIANEEAIEVGKLNFGHVETIHFGCNENFPYYNGGISDIFVDNMQVYLNKSTVKECRHVEIGRERPFSSQAELKMLTAPETTNSMQNTEGCAPISHYTTDERAVKFGDKPNSYVYINSPFWKRDFKLKFDFRTFYPDGLLIISAAPSKTHFNFLQLQKGNIQLYIKGRKKKTLFTDNVNDGMWHTVRISTVVSNVNRKKRKLVVSLDENPKKVVNIPRNTIKGEIYLGGVSEDFTNYIELKNNLLPFRGCMRSVEINDLEQEIVKNSNIGQCFPSVEEGAYFSGDAYAIYKSNFQVNNILELGFQFRTAEQNGILLSVSNNKNSPALSVELQNGAVVMTVDMGNGIISKVTNNLDSEFALCNNKWHNVTALYSNSELTVNIDGITKTWVQSDVNSLMDEIDAPLYIGGLPDNAPIGTLKTRENFKGCIRNMNIEGILMDWTDMENLNNILLNSCPIT